MSALAVSQNKIHAMAPLQLLLLILALLSLEGADAHGTVTKPAMRYNPSVTFQCTCRRLLKNLSAATL